MSKILSRALRDSFSDIGGFSLPESTLEGNNTGTFLLGIPYNYFYLKTISVI
jgi:hypothetical protein